MFASWPDRPTRSDSPPGRRHRRYSWHQSEPTGVCGACNASSTSAASGEPGSSRAGLAKQLGINSGTQAYAIHATIMAWAMTALPAQRPQRPQRPPATKWDRRAGAWRTAARQPAGDRRRIRAPGGALRIPLARAFSTQLTTVRGATKLLGQAGGVSAPTCKVLAGDQAFRNPSMSSRDGAEVGQPLRGIRSTGEVHGEADLILLR